MTSTCAGWARRSIRAWRAGAALLASTAVLSPGASAEEPANDLPPAPARAASDALTPAPIGASIAAREDGSLAPDLLSRTSLNWTGQLNGPSFGKPWGTNYNPFQNDFGPLYVYHTVDAIQYFGPASQVGLELSAKQDMGSAVMGRSGYLIEPSFTLNDPQLWYRQDRIFDGSWLGVDGTFSVFPGLTEYSRSQDFMLFSVALDGTYRIKLPDYRWNAYFTSRFRPTFYFRDALFDGWKRDQVFLSTGHYLGYLLPAGLELATSTSFDCSYYSEGSHSFIRGDAYDDYAQLLVKYHAQSGLYRLGAYVQGLIVDPRLETATVGIDLTINFLRGR